MVKVAVTASSDMRFSAIAENGAICPIGAAENIGGDGTGFRPMQLMLAAMASCAAIDAVLILKKSRVEFERIDIAVEGDRKEGAVPSPYTKIRLRFTVVGQNVDFAKADRAVKLSVEKYCSVSASMDPNIQVEIETVLSPG